MFKRDGIMAVAIAAWLVALPALAHDTARARAMAAPLLDGHPVEVFQKSVEVFHDGQYEDGVFLFYLAQLRWRRYMMANPDLPPDGDAALYASMHDVFGRAINEWAFGDIEALLGLLRDVDSFDAATADVLVPASDYPQVHEHSREGFAAFIGMIEAEADEIRAERLKNGLENR